MRQSPSHAMRCTSVVLLLWLVSCKGVFKDSETENQTFSGPSELIAALRTHPARTLQQLHKEPQSIEKDALILNTVEEFPRRSKPLCPILSTKTAVDRCLRLTERPHLWKRQPHHFAKSSHPTSLERDCTLIRIPTPAGLHKRLLTLGKTGRLQKMLVGRLHLTCGRQNVFLR